MTVLTEIAKTEIVEGTIVVLGDYDSDTLRDIAEEASKDNPRGWLPLMITEYLSVWR